MYGDTSPVDPIEEARRYLRERAGEKAQEVPREVEPSASIIRERINDKAGRTLAVRWVSGIVGDMWVTLDRATALWCGLVRPGGSPIFYLATDDAEFFKDATRDQLERLAEFKKMFLSPEMQ
ncbi:MAG: hypothetical protein HYT87_10465 [Nitrospirae bacterium]|nr:hypothetical protein [Nitrospirota bacterium]